MTAQCPSCSFDGCGKRVIARGLCGAHYQAAKKNGTLEKYQLSGRTPTRSGDCLWCGKSTGSSAMKRYCSLQCSRRANDHAQRCEDFPNCGHERLLRGRTSLPLLERLERHVDRSGGADTCWPWTGNRSASGYGQTYVTQDGRRSTTRAHRAMYIATHGSIPDGLFILHSCDNPPCCNPAHLRAGTHLENMADRKEHGAGYGKRGANQANRKAESA